MFIGAMKTPAQENPEKQQEHLKKQRDILAYRMKKLSAKQEHFIKKTAELKEKIRKKYEDMKRVLDEDLRITMCQLDMEQEAMERATEENMHCKKYLTVMNSKIVTVKVRKL
ncbi:E3 ubiquitin-protein ligase TRIM8-like [Tachysurus fulvidraco]|uniref:E3 ubiquitin-protein ligase TRIM8-like n=1 Tax=Tachysurus fulvidraco TaxID=1234273 RepID=UPI000F4DB0DB|nr:E3 ubiquitin-protein ligase TRIM8-like [Tachysurus fulvidraco]